MSHDTKTINSATPAPVQYGLIAEFEGPGPLLTAATKLREAGYTKFDAHSPFPIHGMDDAMGESRSRVSYIAAFIALGGGLSILLLTWWTSVKAYPMVISGKPFFSYQAFFPVIFAISVLSAAFGALLGFMAMMDLKFHHPLFNSDRFGKFSDDGFIISIESSDPKFNNEKTTALLKSLGSTHVEQVDR